MLCRVQIMKDCGHLNLLVYKRTIITHKHYNVETTLQSKTSTKLSFLCFFVIYQIAPLLITLCLEGHFRYFRLFKLGISKKYSTSARMCLVMNRNVLTVNGRNQIGERFKTTGCRVIANVPTFNNCS